MVVSASDGCASVWDKEESAGAWELDCILGPNCFGDVPPPVRSQKWIWDSAFVDVPEERFIITARDNGICELWDSSRPLSPPIASYDCGGSKAVKSLVILDTASENVDGRLGRVRGK